MYSSFSKYYGITKMYNKTTFSFSLTQIWYIKYYCLTIFDIRFLMNLHISRFPESKNEIFSCWGTCAWAYYGHNLKNKLLQKLLNLVFCIFIYYANNLENINITETLLLYFGNCAYLFSPGEESCYLFSTRNNCWKFLTSYGVIIQSIIQSYL